MDVSMFYLFDRCKVDELATRALFFGTLCRKIDRNLDALRSEKDDEGIRYVTNDSHRTSSVVAEEILWIFLLFHPEHPFVKRLDRKRADFLQGALALDPQDYVYGSGYLYDDVAEKLGCSRIEGRYVTTFWEILPVYSNQERKTLNLPYLIEKGGTVEIAAETYAIYARCSENQARAAIEKYLSEGNEELSVLCPGGSFESRDGETVKRMDFDGKNKEAAWLQIRHPFFTANSTSPEHSEKIFFEYLKNSIYRSPNVAYVYRDRHIEYSGYLTHGHESEDRISFERRETYSYHDGGGGSRDLISISALTQQMQESIKAPNELMTRSYYSERGISMPPCRGYWEEEGVIYVVDPFDMDGIFVLESIDESWDSDYD